MTSLVCDPWVAQRIWRRAMVGARQPLRLSFELDEVAIDGVRTPVDETVSALAPLANLRRFAIGAPPPPTRRSAKFSSFRRFPALFSITMRDVAARMVSEGDVHVVEWLNVAHAPPTTTWFDFDDQIDCIAEAIRRVGPEAHMIALCQGGPPSLIAAAFLGLDEPSRAPMSLSLLSAPLLPTAAPCAVSQSIRERDIGWYRRRTATRVDAASGRMREVYPAEAQLSLMMSTLLAQSPSKDELSRLISRDEGEAPHKRSFLEIVMSFMDVPAEHFLSSLDRIYLSGEGAASPLRWRDRLAPPEALASVALAAIEGESDRIAAPGQTSVALDLFPAQDGVARRKHLIPGLGHFGLFYGAGWRNAVAPRIVSFMHQAARARRRRIASDERAAMTSVERAAAQSDAPVAATA